MKKKIILIISTIILSSLMLVGTFTVSAASSSTLIGTNLHIPFTAKYVLFGGGSMTRMQRSSSGIDYYEFSTQTWGDTTKIYSQGYTLYQNGEYITQAMSANSISIYTLLNSKIQPEYKSYQRYRLLQATGIEYSKAGYILPKGLYANFLEYTFIRFDNNDALTSTTPSAPFENYSYNYTIEIMYGQEDITLRDTGYIYSEPHNLYDANTYVLSLKDILPTEVVNYAFNDNNIYIKRFMFTIDTNTTTKQDILMYMPITEYRAWDYDNLNIQKWTDNIIRPDENPFEYILEIINTFLNNEIFPGFRIWYIFAFGMGTILIGLTVKLLR